MQILKIVLWSKNLNLPPRVINFELGKVNFIVGESDTGKSSIWPIVDYCLCSSELRVPVGDARDLVSWYAIVLTDHKRQLMIARKNNTLKKESSGKFTESEYMVLESASIAIPVVPKRNKSEKAVREMLSIGINKLLKEISKELLDELLVELGDKKIGEFSFRDLLTLNHQMQYALVNPSSFIADSGYISVLKLKKLLPLLLYSEDTAYYKVKKGIQYKFEKERLNLNKQLEYINERMKFLYGEAEKLDMAHSYIDPEKIKPFDEFWRKELENIFSYNVYLLQEKKADPITAKKILTLGKIDECLQFAKVIDRAKEFDYDLQVVKSEVNSIEFDYYQNTESAEILKLSKLIKAYAKKLRLDYLEYMPIFDDKDAILKFSTQIKNYSQYIYLYQLGNTQSYVGYNIATFLSLHEFFIELKQSSIFSFLLIDHPGQAFSSGKKNDDEDRFKILNETLDFAAGRLDGKFQMIVLERVVPDKGLSNSVVIENWSNLSKKTLIPNSWKNDKQ